MNNNSKHNEIIAELLRISKINISIVEWLAMQNVWQNSTSQQPLKIMTQRVIYHLSNNNNNVTITSKAP